MSERTRAGRLLASAAIVLAMAFLIEMTIKTPPQAGEVAFSDAVRVAVHGI